MSVLLDAHGCCHLVVGRKVEALGWARWTGYTACMDSVRFGRVLGIGTRLAAKTVAAAVDAAAAQPPAAKTSEVEGKSMPGAPAQQRVASTVAPVPQAGTQVRAQEIKAQVQQAQAQVKKTGAGIKQGGKRFGEAVWGPFVRLSGVLWLEFTGVFFGVFALSAGIGAWKLRGAVHGAAANGDSHMRFLLTVGMALLFGYFCVSSFIKAARRERRR
jgi:hypothetical protein